MLCLLAGCSTVRDNLDVRHIFTYLKPKGKQCVHPEH